LILIPQFVQFAGFVGFCLGGEKRRGEVSFFVGGKGGSLEGGIGKLEESRVKVG
jgi:hypothetical protein